MPKTLDNLIAHSAPEGGTEQSMREHLGNVAALASSFAAPFGSAAFAEWLGWWHDAGKVADDVQAYLTDSKSTPPGPDHSSAGMLEAVDRFEPFAFNIAGHHGGLPDASDLKTRIQRKREEKRVVIARAEAALMLQAVVPVLHPAQVPDFIQQGTAKERNRHFEFWLRMLHAALVDADCLDTEAHFDAEKAARRVVKLPSMQALWKRFAAKQEVLTQSAPKTEVNQLRAQVYRACLEAASEAQGIFSLTVPTGGGKTRSALAFGLRHALTHGLRRIIIALPYTSIIEQNADVYRELLGDEAVLEHHSAVHSREQAAQSSATERWERLAAENWDAPLVVTTTVQFFESLFAHRNSRLRKLHNLPQSVVILDEVQTLPPELLTPTLDVMRHLVDAYGITFMLCTATQPALQARADFLEGLQDVREIIPDTGALYQALRRVAYDVRTDERWSWQRVADTLQQAPQAMVVLNTIRDAMAVLDELSDTDDVLHLSTQLCGAHRREVLAKIRRRLKRGKPVRLVTTQVVEAGVDIDFPLVLRAMGPLDRIIQAAGRCNREGRLEKGHMIVFEPEDGHLPPNTYRRGTEITQALFHATPDLDLHAPDVPPLYFQRLYDVSNLDAKGIQALRQQLCFEKVGRAYRLIEEEAFPVVVPYDASADKKGAGRTPRERIVARIEARGKAVRTDFRALQPYLVNLRPWIHEKASADGLCRELAPGLWIWEGRYDQLRGLQHNQGTLNPRDLVR